MKKLISLTLVIVLALVAFYFLKPCPRCEVEETLQKELYSLEGEIGKYQFQVGDKRMRYWTVSDVIYFNLNKEQTKTKFKADTKGSESPQTLMYISDGDTVTVSEGSEEMGEILLGPSIVDDIDPCQFNLPEFQQCCNNRSTSSEDDNCQEPPPGGTASKCQIISIWINIAFSGFVNNYPDLLKVKSKLVQGDNTIIPGKPKDDYLTTFETNSIKNGPVNLEVELTNIKTNKTTTLSVPFLARTE